jgi:hypothetical protein
MKPSSILNQSNILNLILPPTKKYVAIYKKILFIPRLDGWSVFSSWTFVCDPEAILSTNFVFKSGILVLISMVLN